MTAAGTVGAGVAADISFAPTDKARYLGRFNPNAVWADLQGCAPFPYLTNEQQESIYEQMVCHLEGGVGHLGGSTFDFEAWRPVMPAFTSLVTAHCNPDLGPGAGVQYIEDIIQWSGDNNPQKTAWLVTRAADGTLERRWIPTSEIYYCLKGAGKGGPFVLDHSYIATYLAPVGLPATRDEFCGHSQSPPPPGGGGGALGTGTVTLAQGPVALQGYKYAITLSGFAANSAVSITCFDSASPGGFYTFTLTTNSVGGASTASYCYSGDGPDHWVIAGGVQSNHVTWGGWSSSPPPTTWSEQETPNHPVNTFTNYHNASGMGPAIAAGQWVQVSCKVYDPTIQSVNPDGYWYRIASAPWSNAYYSPANTFMNGDPYGGPYTHNTDFAVPDC
jgi:hypothetical protein